ncbi:prepilin-type N-terminal cleavage/methylation domain-containing protein [Roseateles sp.]|jgi:type IV pilus assembly protein PilA|uniref:pilin n=1 Tax=Roseateles sp. TaxID=1971397 RepID=UPI0037C6B8B4
MSIKKRAQQGFTLIELMIVVAIIGILAAVALPAYQDYTTKSKVSEAAQLISVAKKNMVVAFNEGTLSATSDNTSLGLGAANTIQGKYVTSVTAAGTGATTGTITAVMRATGDTNVDGQSIVWLVTCVAGGSCNTTVSAAAPFPAKFLPKT